MRKIEYLIEVILPTSQEQAWRTITDFNAYPQWNSILRMEKNNPLEIGRKFSVQILDGKNASKFKAVLIDKHMHYSFAARQTILAKWFMSATHHFIIEKTPNDPVAVRFIQKWELTGIICQLLKKQIFRQLALFKRMNHELKVHIEQQNVVETS